MAMDWLPASLSKQGLKKNPSVCFLMLVDADDYCLPFDLQLIPLLVITAAGGVWAGYYIWRLAAKSPEVM